MKSKISILLMVFFVSFSSGKSLAGDVSACNDSIISLKPNDIYRDNLDGTITDIQTGLVWMKCSIGQYYEHGECYGDASLMDWKSAFDGIENGESSTVFIYGFSDWRVPNKKELDSLLDRSCHDPAINHAVFPGTLAEDYWVSSAGVSDAGRSWAIDFSSGVHKEVNKNVKNALRLVRGGF